MSTNPPSQTPQPESWDLARFVRAQAGLYQSALTELQRGAKRTHWMWFIFPQIAGLGQSDNSRYFGISGRREALAYLDHDLLGPRLLECTDAVLEWADRKSAVQIFGPIDALKLQSSMTLFEAVVPGLEQFGRTLDTFFDGRRDDRTLELLAEKEPEDG